jgi:hypothetical protein
VGISEFFYEGLVFNEDGTPRTLNPEDLAELEDVMRVRLMALLFVWFVC